LHQLAIISINLALATLPASAGAQQARKFFYLRA
jgi:hypothetical protein